MSLFEFSPDHVKNLTMYLKRIFGTMDPHTLSNGSSQLLKVSLFLTDAFL